MEEKEFDPVSRTEENEEIEEDETEELEELEEAEVSDEAEEIEEAEARDDFATAEFEEISEKYGNGVMYDIEVLNELLETHRWTTNSVISDKRDSLEWSFDLAKKYFPNDVLVINDGNFIPQIGVKTYRHPYYMLIDAALAKGTRIDKIGI